MHKPLQNFAMKFIKPITNSLTIVLPLTLIRYTIATEGGERYSYRSSATKRGLHAPNIYGMRPPLKNRFMKYLMEQKCPLIHNFFRSPFKQKFSPRLRSSFREQRFGTPKIH